MHSAFLFIPVVRRLFSNLLPPQWMMDLLKRELQRRRELLQEDFAGRKLLKRSEIQRREIQRLRQEELRRVRPKPEPIPSTPERSTAGGAGGKASGDLPLPLSLPLPSDEVIRRLRVLQQPATLFGEDDAARLRRLNEVIESGPIKIEEEEIGDGQTNDFLRDIHELRRRQRAGVVKPKNGGAGYATEATDAAGGVFNEESDGGRRGGRDEDAKRMEADFAELCEEDKILVFFKRLLGEWGQEVEGMRAAEKRTAKGKFTVATFNQCARYLNPLFKMCRKKWTAPRDHWIWLPKALICPFFVDLADEEEEWTAERVGKEERDRIDGANRTESNNGTKRAIGFESLPDDIRKALLSVVECCMKRDYLAAMDEYIKLAIGNAPWPIGVTMVGIHERSAREKIYTNSVAHIMNDETTRKYLQSVKRLMTFCQRRYPANPSRSVEFNSLANGSDLQSLLAKEQASKSLVSGEGLRLVSAK